MKNNTRMDELKFRKLLADVGRNIRDDELKTMKFMCSSLDIPTRRMEEIQSAIDLWTVLQEQDCLAVDNTEFLKELLAHRPDLLSLVTDFENTNNADTVKVDDDNHGETPENFADLEEEFDYVCSNLGKDWKKLGRVMGFKAADFDGFEERHPKNLYERIRLMLNTWVENKECQVGREDLVEKLKVAKFAMIAHYVKNLE